MLSASKTIDETAAALTLLTPLAVRERAHEMLALALADELPHFRVDMTKLAPAAIFVAGVIRENYPALNVPLHSRWRHFVLKDRNLWAEIAERTAWPDAAARARAAFDLAIISVLLDAGSGPNWRYHDKSGATVARSEGLALATLRMFEDGLFSADPRDPLRADAKRLAALTCAELAAGFQVTTGNELAGLAGRAELLARVGHSVSTNPAVFARSDGARPGGLFDAFVSGRGNTPLPAPTILTALLNNFGPIWTGRLTLAGVPLGDTWRHHAIKRADVTNGLVPLHKLSQWLAYSLIEPLRDAGITVTDLDGLTGLAEYRNGGLFIDTGVLTPRDANLAQRSLSVDSEPVVEWRALTVALLDSIAPLVREQLGVGAQQLPLGAVLEGGTWAAGRKIAKLQRGDGRPPLTVISDGTVF